MKKTKSLCLIFVLLLTFLLTPFMDKSVLTAKAATLKINKNQITLKEGETFNLKISGTKKTVKWSSDTRLVATVSAKGKVTAVSIGSAQITASINGRKLYCYVTVIPSLTKKEALKNIQYTAYDLDRELLLSVKNNNKDCVDLNIKVVYYNEDNKTLSMESNDIYSMIPGKDYYVNFYHPSDSNLDYISFDRYEIYLSVNLDQTNILKDYSEQLITESSVGADSIVAKITNKSDVKVNCVTLSAVFYKDGKIVGHSLEIILDDIEPGQFSFCDFDLPSDKDYNPKEYDDYKVFVNDAYNLDF